MHICAPAHFVSHTNIQKDVFNYSKTLVYRFIYETEQFNGVGELLEILGRYVDKLIRLECVYLHGFDHI